MKFYERFKPTSLVTLISIIFLFYSCGGDSTDAIDEDNIDDIESYKLLKRVTYTDFWYGEQILEFTYSNELLIAKNNGGESETFEYDDGRIVLWSGIDLNYDDKGNLISDIYPDGADSLYYTYDDNGNVLSMYVTDGGGGYTITYEFDGKKNPFSVLWEKYGYYDDGGQRFEPYQMVGCIFKQNATKVYKDNELELEVNYTYDSDGYPISCGFTEYFSDGSTREGDVSFTYVE